MYGYTLLFITEYACYSNCSVLLCKDFVNRISHRRAQLSVRSSILVVKDSKKGFMSVEIRRMLTPSFLHGHSYWASMNEDCSNPSSPHFLCGHN